MGQEVKVFGYSGREPFDADLKMLMPALDLIGELGWTDVQERVRAGSAQVWVIQEDDVDVAACLTEMIDYPRISSLRVIAIGGEEMIRWQESLFQAMVEFCRENKLGRIEAVCRPGLEKIMKPLGFVKRFVCLMREVSNGKVSRPN